MLFFCSVLCCEAHRGFFSQAFYSRSGDLSCLSVLEMYFCHCNPLLNPVKPRTFKSYPTLRFYFYLAPSQLYSHVLRTFFFFERKAELTLWEADNTQFIQKHILKKKPQWIEGNLGSLSSYVSVTCQQEAVIGLPEMKCTPFTPAMVRELCQLHGGLLALRLWWRVRRRKLVYHSHRRTQLILVPSSELEPTAVHLNERGEREEGW